MTFSWFQEKIEAEPLDIGFQALPGNGFKKFLCISSSFFLLPSSFFLLPSSFFLQLSVRALP
ncbi:hypothetical protein C7B69_11705 [filamentous cyanobacterium Phorm 46]|nr:hypothetical protein C7B69_11705 [filamentous cyanobacterium Phorm 46]PSB52564.1 hypothetical protein C7B67_06520 [filamentous cyanobacterium Phorm 6]